MVENETMHISLSHKTLHFKKPAKTSRGEYTTHDSIIITIRDEKSHRIGLGECAPLPDLSYDRHSYLRMSDVANLIDAALASTCYNDCLRPYPALLFALESALYDYQQNPILYNTPFAKSEVGIPTNGLVWMSDYDEMLAQAKKKILAGHRCIKFKIGAIKWEDEMRLLNKIRSRFTKDTLEIRVDANGGLGLDMDIVRNKLQELSKYNIHSIEQPIPQYHWNEMAELCKLDILPIALDEELIGVNDIGQKQLMLDTINPHYIVLKPTLHGGITGTLEWISEARKRGISSWITSALESNIGLRNIALLAARAYGPNITLAQGLGTGQLFTDNIEMDIEMRGAKLWRCKVED